VFIIRGLHLYLKKYSQGEQKIGHSEPVRGGGLKREYEGTRKSLNKVFLFD
jgi:hypothetical protein